MFYHSKLHRKNNNFEENDANLSTFRSDRECQSIIDMQIYIFILIVFSFISRNNAASFSPSSMEMEAKLSIILVVGLLPQKF